MDWEAVANILAEKSNLPTVLLDQAGRIRMINRAMETVLACSRFDVQGEAWIRACVPPSYEEETNRCLTEALRGALSSARMIAVAGDKRRIAFSMEFSLVGRGAAQGLLLTALQTVALNAPVGPLEDEEFDYDVTRGRDLIVVRGEAVDQHHPRCFTFIYGRDAPCEQCPCAGDGPWPHTTVEQISDSTTRFAIRTAEPSGPDAFHVRLRLLPEPTLHAIRAARIDAVAKHAKLSPREREILERLLLGRHVEDIAATVGIAVRTVKYHQTNILEKLGAESRSDLLRLFL